MTLLQQAKFIQSIRDLRHGMNSIGQLNLDGAGINFISDLRLAGWFDRSYGYINQQANENADAIEITTTMSDETMAEVLELFDNEQFQAKSIANGDRTYRSIQVTPETSLDYFPFKGSAWFRDDSESRQTFICTSRTLLPIQEFRLGCDELIYRQLSKHGWHFLPATAITHEGKTVLLFDRGEGMLSGLVAKLLGDGASLLGCGEVALKLSQDGIAIQPLPASIAIEVGWASEFPQLTNYISRPDLLRTYQEMFDPTRVWGSTPEQRLGLPDKLIFCPDELASALGSEHKTITGPVHVDSVAIVQVSDDTGKLPADDSMLSELETSLKLYRDQTNNSAPSVSSAANGDFDEIVKQIVELHPVLANLNLNSVSNFQLTS